MSQANKMIKWGAIMLIVGAGLNYLLIPPRPDRALLEVVDVTYDEDLEVITLWIKNNGRQSAVNVIAEFRLAGMLDEAEIESGETWIIWAHQWMEVSALPYDHEFALLYEWTDSKGVHGEFGEVVFVHVTEDDIV